MGYLSMAPLRRAEPGSFAARVCSKLLGQLFPQPGGENNLLHEAILETDGHHPRHLVNQKRAEAFGSDDALNGDGIAVLADFIDAEEAKIGCEPVLVPLLDALSVPERADVELQNRIVGEVAQTRIEIPRGERVQIRYGD
jgi:hypothetical protein